MFGMLLYNQFLNLLHNEIVPTLTGVIVLPELLFDGMVLFSIVNFITVLLPQRLNIVSLLSNESLQQTNINNGV